MLDAFYEFCPIGNVSEMAFYRLKNPFGLTCRASCYTLRTRQELIIGQGREAVEMSTEGRFVKVIRHKRVRRV